MEEKKVESLTEYIKRISEENSALRKKDEEERKKNEEDRIKLLEERIKRLEERLVVLVPVLPPCVQPLRAVPPEYPLPHTLTIMCRGGG